MAAQNRRRNDTSKHAVGVWEEFSFLDKGNFGTWGQLCVLGAERVSTRCVFPFENGNQIIWRSS